MISEIEQIIVFPSEDKYHVRILGWAFDEGHVNAKIQMQAFCDVQAQVLAVRERVDVAQKYMNYGDVTDCGFVCDFEFEKSCPSEGKIELYLEEGEWKTVVCSYTIKQLEKKLFPMEMKCVIDTVNYMMGTMTVQGWACSYRGWLDWNRPSISVETMNGRKMDCQVIPVAREDVVRQMGQREDNWNLGYRLQWQALANETYRVIFQDGEHRKEYKVSQDGVRKATYYLKKAAGKGLRIAKRILGNGHDNYSVWEKKHRLTKEAWTKQREHKFAYEPCISVVVPAFRTPEKFLREMMDSVREQSYENWELCIADGSMDGSICGILEEYHQLDSRIKYQKLDDNYGISGNTNQALELATGDYVALLDHDDLLTADALYEVVKRINETDAEVLYTDEDKVSMDLKTFFDPHFKPDYSIDLLHSCNYICHFFVVKQNVLQQVGLFREECNGSQDFDFILRCTSAANRVEHIAKIVYHWRCHPNSTAGDPASKMYCYEAGKRAVELDLQAQGISGASVAIDAHFGYYRASYPDDGDKKVSVVILPGRDERSLLKTKEAIQNQNPEACCEVIVANQGDTVVQRLNMAAEKATGDYILFLEAGMVPTNQDYIQVLRSNCRREEVGAVAATVLLNRRYVLCSGAVLSGEAPYVRDLFQGKQANEVGYVGRMLAQQNVSMVSWRGMMIAREKWEEMNGFSDSFQNAGFDADLCLRLLQKGYWNVYTPYTHFSVNSEEYRQWLLLSEQEEQVFAQKWQELMKKPDPFYNVNFSKKKKMFSLS